MHKSTLIMLPPFMCNEELFKEQKIKLSSFCNIIIPVLKEYNNITEAAKYVLSIAPKEFYLAGISMGGYIVMEMLKLSQDRIKKLCLRATKCEENYESQKTYVYKVYN